MTQVTFKTSSGGSITKKIEYDYDTADRRIAKRVYGSGGTTLISTERFVYTGGNVALEFDGAGSLTNCYLHGPDVDQLFADEDAVDGLLWALADHQQTVRDLVDSTGTVVNHVEYDSFGAISGQSNGALTPLSAYTGQHWDADAELYYYDARWYDPGVGRFVSEDPSGLGPDANLYRYVENSPWNYTDPTGRVLRNAVDSVVSALPQAIDAAGRGIGNFFSDLGSTFSSVAGAMRESPAVLEHRSVLYDPAYSLSRMSCMACHTPGVLDGRVAFSDLPREYQVAIQRWNHPPSPEYAAVSLLTFHGPMAGAEATAGVMLAPGTGGSSLYLTVDAASGLLGTFDAAAQGELSNRYGVGSIDFVGNAWGSASTEGKGDAALFLTGR